MHVTILRISELLTQVENLVVFSGMFIWLIGFYLLYKLTRHKFMLWLIWGELLAIVAYVAVYLTSEQLTSAIASGAKDLYSQGIIGLAAARLLRFIAVVVSTTGAFLAFLYVRARYRNDIPR